MRRRILFLSPYLPYPPRHGGRIRSFALLRELAAHHEVRVLCGLAEEDDGEAVAGLEARGIPVSGERVVLPRRLGPAAKLGKLLRVLSRRSYLLPRFGSRELEGRLREALAEFDPELIILDHLWLWPLVRGIGQRPLLWSSHNVESEALRGGAVGGSLYDRFCIGREALRLEAAEDAACRRASVTVAVSPEDRDHFRARNPDARCELVPNGAELASVPLLPSAEDAPRFLFVGGYDYPPNLEAAQRIGGEILPAMRALDGEAEFGLVGRDPGGALRAFEGTPGWRHLGFVESLEPAYERASVVVVPLRYGGGSRLKILEAWAQGRAVVSTAAGAAGLDAVDGEHLVVAESSEELARAALALASDRARREALVARAREKVEKDHDWAVLARRFRELAEEAAFPVD